MTTDSPEKDFALFGHPIKPTFRLTLAEQVYDALCREIHAGRWRVGDRLPGTSALAELSGLSHNVVQRALEALREDGYVRMEKRRGTFLRATLPQGTAPRGVVGIAMTLREEVGSSQYDYVYLSRIHAIIQAATERAYTTEVVSLDEEADWERIDAPDGPFGRRVVGIFCLHAFPRPLPPPPEEGRIPMVFLEPPPGLCRPAVYHDGFLAAYLATRAALRAGHERIALYCGPPHPHNGIDISIRGHRAAMKEYGAPVDEDALRASLAHSGRDLSEMRQFLERSSGASAVISATSATGRRLVSVCDVLGIRIPHDLSIVSQASAPMRGNDSSLVLAGPKADPTRSIEEAFDVLDRTISGQGTARTEILLQPDFIEGDSLERNSATASPSPSTKRKVENP